MRNDLAGINEGDVLRRFDSGRVSVGVVGPLDAAPPQGLGHLLARPVRVGFDAVAAPIAEKGLE